VVFETGKKHGLTPSPSSASKEETSNQKEDCMPAKHKRKYSLSELQVEQINVSYANLGRLHSDASRKLRNIGGSISASKRANLKLRGTADQITNELQFIEAILSSSQEPRVQVIFQVNLPYDPPCTHNTDPPPEPIAETGIPAPDPAHRRELDQLIDSVNQRGYRWARSHTNSIGMPLPGLKRLQAALVKELRYFCETTAAAPPLPIQFLTNECSICKLAEIIDDPMES